MRLAIAVLVASACLGQASAEEPDTRKLAEDLLTHVDRIAEMIDHIEAVCHAS